jgi:hypothetical protein
MKISHASIDPKGQNLLIHLAQPGHPDVVLNLSIAENDLEISIANKPDPVQIKIIGQDAPQTRHYHEWRRRRHP